MHPSVHGKDQVTKANISRHKKKPKYIFYSFLCVYQLMEAGEEGMFKWYGICESRASCPPLFGIGQRVLDEDQDSSRPYDLAPRPPPLPPLPSVSSTGDAQED
jgi:hypothetical protein